MQQPQGKTLPHHLKALNDLLQNPQFQHDESFAQNLEFFKRMREKEELINKFMVKKRTDFQESLKFQPEKIRSSLRIYLQTSFVNELDEKYVKFNLLGKFVLNGEFSNSFAPSQLEKDSQVLFQTDLFPSYVKKLEVVPSYLEYFEQPMKLDKKDLLKLKHEKDFSNKVGFSMRKKILKLLHQYPVSFTVKIWLKQSLKTLELTGKLKEFMGKE